MKRPQTEKKKPGRKRSSHGKAPHASPSQGGQQTTLSKKKGRKGLGVSEPFDSVVKTATATLPAQKKKPGKGKNKGRGGKRKTGVQRVGRELAIFPKPQKATNQPIKARGITRKRVEGTRLRGRNSGGREREFSTA